MWAMLNDWQPYVCSLKCEEEDEAAMIQEFAQLDELSNEALALVDGARGG